MHHQNLEQLKALRLFGMARALEELAHTRERDALTFDDQLALLIEREAADRANLALTHRLRRAHLRQNACLENLDLRTPRGLDRALVRDLASCRWVSEHRPILVIGPTGVGKTWIGKTWIGKTWIGKTWIGKTWIGKTWIGKTWIGKTWIGKTWIVCAL